MRLVIAILEDAKINRNKLMSAMERGSLPFVRAIVLLVPKGALLALYVPATNVELHRGVLGEDIFVLDYKLKNLFEL